MSKLHADISQFLNEQFACPRHVTADDIIEIPLKDAVQPMEKLAVEYHKKRYLRPYDLRRLGIRESAVKAYVRLTPSFEDFLFGNYFKYADSSMYHYTSYDALFHILGQKRLRLSSLPGLNDKEETSKGATGLLRAIKNPSHFKHVEALNSRFVLSCSELVDDLNQWRLYGDDGRGVCIELLREGALPKDYYLGRIDYRDDYFDRLAAVAKSIYRKHRKLLVFNSLHIWSYFVKSSMWSNEKEVRLLFWERHKAKADWYRNRYDILTRCLVFRTDDFPLRVVRIILGPKFPEPETNLSQLKWFARESNGGQPLDVDRSGITNYR